MAEPNETNEQIDLQTADPEMEPDTTKQKSKKRKEMKDRSDVWVHFEKIMDGNGNLIKAKCIYCKRVWAADPKKHGSTNLRNHMVTGKQNPNIKNPGQTQFKINKLLVNNKGEYVVGQPSNWRFDHSYARKSIAEMKIIDELPFSVVEKSGFKHFVSISLPPTFALPSRRTITRDCLEIYTKTKANMKLIIKMSKQRVSLTTDTWTSNQRLSYMCLTAHWIDEEWKLQKSVLNFTPIESHRGADIAEAIGKCLIEWGIDKLFCVTVDNASANETAIRSLKSVLKNWGTSICDSEHLHMRCVAHILNLVVHEGLKDISESVNAVRAAVRYVRQSPARLKKFKDCAEREKIECNRALCLDVPTRWNSTYMMPDVAEKFQRAFERYDRQDPQFEKELNVAPLRVPNDTDWDVVKRMVNFLKFFYDMTVRVSGSLYVTSNSFLLEISAIDNILQDWKCSTDIELSLMANRMKSKFEKYWGQPEQMNKVIYIAVILDPTKKLEFLTFVLTEMYGLEKGKKLEKLIKEATYRLFNAYRNCNESSHVPKSGFENMGSISSTSDDVVSGSDCQGIAGLMNRFKKFKNQSGSAIKKTELDKYLGEDVEDEQSFDILRWWKVNQPRFPILAEMARDVLAVPISTVASESTFSTGGRVLDDFRSSLTPKMVEALICAQDWIRPCAKPVNIEEDCNLLEKIEQDVAVDHSTPNTLES